MGRGALMILLCAGAAGAQSFPRGHQALLDKVTEAYTGVQSYQVEAVVTTQRKGAPAPKRSAQEVVSISYSAPNRLRLESNTLPAVTVFDDQGVSTYSKAMSTYREAAGGGQGSVNDYAHRRDALARIGFADYGSIEDEMDSARVLRQENMTVDGAAVPCAVVEASYPHGVKRTFWVDTRRNVVLREVDFGSPDGAELEHTIVVRKLSWNQPLPESLFEFKAPAVGKRDNGMVPPVALVRCQQPRYTEEARTAHLAGVVTMSLTIEDDGTPNDIHVTNPLGLGLDESAASCMAQSRYSPARKDGKPVPLKIDVSLTFQAPSDSDWHLGGATFQSAQGDSRPILVKAKYPAASGDKRSSRVCLHLTVGVDGVPRNIQVASPQDAKLDKQAMAIAGSWRFQPGTSKGRPVEVPATFTLIHGPGNRLVSAGRVPE